MHQCESCHSGTYQTPRDNHPSYVICNACGAMKLQYQPMPYQEEMHTYTSGDEIDIIAVFGGFG